MSHSKCRLCLDDKSETVDVFDTRCQGISLRIIIHKLFGLKFKSEDGSVHICQDCKAILSDCYSFYEKVQKAQLDINLIKQDVNIIPVDKIKQEIIHPIHHIDTDGRLNLESNGGKQIKQEAFNGDCLFKSDLPDICNDSGDDFVFDENYESLKDDLSDEYDDKQISKKKIKKKKKTAKKKLTSLLDDLKSGTPPLAKKKKVKKKIVKTPKITNDISLEDPKVLINENGSFIVKRNALEALINKFFNLECDLCPEPKKHDNIKELFEHYEVAHKTKGYIRCCDAQFRIRKSINNHLARHLQPSAFECHICKKLVTRPEDLKYHVESHLPEAERSLQCDQCDKRFAYPSHLRLHKYSHTPMDQRQIHKCNICSKVFTLPIFLSIHISSKHTAKYLCPHCGKKYKEKSHYNNHLRAHNPQEEDKVECKECGKVLSHMDGLRRHMRRHAVALQCPQCEYVAHRNAELNKHLRIRHTDLKPYVCVVCGKGFKLKRSCTVHMAQHTGERNYTCPFCARTFVDPANCYSHQRKMHPVEFKNKPKLR